MIWPFRKRTPREDYSCSEDWRAGDLAKCVGEFPDLDEIDPKVGDVLRVSNVCKAYSAHYNVRFIALQFEGKPANRGWSNTAFRKLQPENKAADATFAAWLRDTIKRPEPVA